MTKIFVYGTLKRGCCRAHVLRHQEFLGEVSTAPRYRLYNTGSYPAMVEDSCGISVEGELWEVDDECLAVLDAIEGVPTLYERRPVVLEQFPEVDVQTYLYRQSVEGLDDCGSCWHEDRQGQKDAPVELEPLCVVDAGQPEFEVATSSVAVVCAGDSITGWNNHGPVRSWPVPTYPRFLQVLCAPRGLRIADGGMAGEISDNGLSHVARYLELFPEAEFFVVGYGTNDLAICPDIEGTGARIIDNLQAMIEAIRGQGMRPLLINVPYVKEAAFPSNLARETHDQRDYHNARLREYSRREGIPLADICASLRDEHLGDALHPNEAGARIIAEEVFRVLSSCLDPPSNGL